MKFRNARHVVLLMRIVSHGVLTAEQTRIIALSLRLLSEAELYASHAVRTVTVLSVLNPGVISSHSQTRGKPMHDLDYERAAEQSLTHDLYTDEKLLAAQADLREQELLLTEAELRVRDRKLARNQAVARLANVQAAWDDYQNDAPMSEHDYRDYGGSRYL